MPSDMPQEGTAMDRLETLSAALLDAARKAGADAADVIVSDGLSATIDIRRGALERAERAEGIDLGLRVFLGQRSAIVASAETSPDTLAAMAERAVAMAREAPEDPYSGLADPGEIARTWDLAALDLADTSAEPTATELEQTARAAEAAALRPGVTQAEGSASFWRGAVHLAASNGFSGGYARTQSAVSAVAYTGEGTAMEHDWAAEARVHRADLPDTAGIGARAADRALARLGARKPPTGAFPVLFDERVAASLIGHLLTAANGASVARGSGWLRDRLGEPVLPAALSLAEDPHRPRAMGSKPFDAEGLPTRPRLIVDKGVLTGWTLDLASARKLGMVSTASATRGTGGPPSPNVTNTELTQGSASRDDLIAQMGRGLIVTSLIGASINPTTGDYSRGAFGFWVERGEIVHPVNECTIAGNLRDFLLRLTPANDARPERGSRVPSLLVEGLTLAGE
jgi:PmbA protein